MNFTAQIEDKILETYLRAQAVYGRTFDLPALALNIRSTKIAGQANYQQNLIKINPAFLQHDPDMVINRTVPHEAAHLLCHAIYPHSKQHHGPEWKSVARAIGTSDERCHTMTLPGTRPNVYKCRCKTWQISNLIHRRIMSGQRGAICPKCKSNLSYVNSFE